MAGPTHPEKLLGRTDDPEADIKERIRAFSPEDQGRISDAITLAHVLHNGYPRRDGSRYVDHVLRAGRHVLVLEGLTDSDLVCTAILHDSIEEGLDELVRIAEEMGITGETPKAAALEVLRRGFGDRVTGIVARVTRDKDYSKTKEERDAGYAVHMEETIRDVDAFYVKLADFYDNALSFHLVGDPDERKRRAKKYLPAFEKMLARLWEDAVAIAPERKIKISEDLAIGYTRAREILNEDA